MTKINRQTLVTGLGDILDYLLLRLCFLRPRCHRRAEDNGDGRRRDAAAQRRAIGRCLAHRLGVDPRRPCLDCSRRPRNATCHSWAATRDRPRDLRAGHCGSRSACAADAEQAANRRLRITTLDI